MTLPVQYKGGNINLPIGTTIEPTSVIPSVIPNNTNILQGISVFQTNIPDNGLLNQNSPANNIALPNIEQQMPEKSIYEVKMLAKKIGSDYDYICNVLMGAADFRNYENLLQAKINQDNYKVANLLFSMEYSHFGKPITFPVHYIYGILNKLNDEFSDSTLSKGKAEIAEIYCKKTMELSDNKRIDDFKLDTLQEILSKVNEDNINIVKNLASSGTLLNISTIKLRELLDK